MNHNMIRVISRNVRLIDGRWLIANVITNNSVTVIGMTMTEAGLIKLSLFGSQAMVSQ